MKTTDINTITRELGLDKEGDQKAARLLDSLAAEFDEKHLKKTLSGKKVFVFGCGPSLKKDAKKIAENKTFRGYAIVAADGATKALTEERMKPDIIVTDLDGDVDSIVNANKAGATVILHAHADNIDGIRKHFSRLEGRVYGTTQREPTKKLRNYGGFTDGDRAVHLAHAFKPEVIVLAGMDYGKKIGEYSGAYNPKNKAKKLRIGKKLLEELAAKKQTKILNITSAGEKIKNIPQATTKELEKSGGRSSLSCRKTPYARE